MRLYVGIEFIDISVILSYITNYNIKVRLKNIIENHNDLANDTTINRTYLSFVLVIGYCLKLSKIVFLIMTITYFLGVFWFIISLLLHNSGREFRESADSSVFNTETYISDNDVHPENTSKSNAERLVQLMYFSYTTLSTVGFGDITPRSDYERLI